MLRVQKQPVPLDYSKCDRAITVYHLDASKQVHRIVIEHAFLEQERAHDTKKTGGVEQSSFLLVIPQSSCVYLPPAQFAGEEGTYTLANLDKVLPGVGPVVGLDDWAAFIPARVPELVVVSNVAVKYWQRQICHLEAE